VEERLQHGLGPLGRHPGLESPEHVDPPAPAIVEVDPLGGLSAFIIIGTRTCGDWAMSSPVKPGSETPMMVKGTPFTTIVWPTISGSASNRVRQ
jgi:hypothetical protein